MSASPIPFAFEDHLVRAVRDARGEPWFVAKDVCRVLEISDHHQAIDSLDDDERGRYNVPTPSGNQEMKTVSESGLYSLIFRSRKPEARRFRKWVTAEVLPSLRRTGAYCRTAARQPQPEERPHLVLKGSLRASALHAAVQVAKMQNGDEQEVERLFARYCFLFAEKPASVPTTAAAFELEAWAESNLRRTKDPGRGRNIRHLVTQARDLYAAYHDWSERRGLAPVSQRAWGRWMRERFEFRESYVQLYFAMLGLPGETGKTA
jgi:prophage antirepressor-like protein